MLKSGNKTLSLIRDNAGFFFVDLVGVASDGEYKLLDEQGRKRGSIVVRAATLTFEGEGSFELKSPNLPGINEMSMSVSKTLTIEGKLLARKKITIKSNKLNLNSEVVSAHVSLSIESALSNNNKIIAKNIDINTAHWSNRGEIIPKEKLTVVANNVKHYGKCRASKSSVMTFQVKNQFSLEENAEFLSQGFVDIAAKVFLIKDAKLMVDSLCLTAALLQTGGKCYVNQVKALNVQEWNAYSGTVCKMIQNTSNKNIKISKNLRIASGAEMTFQGGESDVYKFELLGGNCNFVRATLNGHELVMDGGKLNVSQCVFNAKTLTFENGDLAVRYSTLKGDALRYANGSCNIKNALLDFRETINIQDQVNIKAIATDIKTQRGYFAGEADFSHVVVRAVDVNLLGAKKSRYTAVQFDVDKEVFFDQRSVLSQVKVKTKSFILKNDVAMVQVAVDTVDCYFYPTTLQGENNSIKTKKCMLGHSSTYQELLIKALFIETIDLWVNGKVHLQGSKIHANSERAYGDSMQSVHGKLILSKDSVLQSDGLAHGGEACEIEVHNGQFKIARMLSFGNTHLHHSAFATDLLLQIRGKFSAIHSLIEAKHIGFSPEASLSLEQSFFKGSNATLGGALDIQDSTVNMSETILFYSEAEKYIANSSIAADEILLLDFLRSESNAISVNGKFDISGDLSSKNDQIKTEDLIVSKSAKIDHGKVDAVSVKVNDILALNQSQLTSKTDVTVSGNAQLKSNQSVTMAATIDINGRLSAEKSFFEASESISVGPCAQVTVQNTKDGQGSVAFHAETIKTGPCATITGDRLQFKAPIVENEADIHLSDSFVATGDDFSNVLGTVKANKFMQLGFNRYIWNFRGHLESQTMIQNSSFIFNNGTLYGKNITTASLVNLNLGATWASNYHQRALLNLDLGGILTTPDFSDGISGLFTYNNVKRLALLAVNIYAPGYAGIANFAAIGVPMAYQSSKILVSVGNDIYEKGFFEVSQEFKDKASNLEFHEWMPLLCDAADMYKSGQQMTGSYYNMHQPVTPPDAYTVAGSVFSVFGGTHTTQNVVQINGGVDLSYDAFHSSYAIISVGVQVAAHAFTVNTNYFSNHGVTAAGAQVSVHATDSDNVGTIYAPTQVIQIEEHIKAAAEKQQQEIKTEAVHVEELKQADETVSVAQTEQPIKVVIEEEEPNVVQNIEQQAEEADNGNVDPTKWTDEEIIARCAGVLGFVDALGAAAAKTEEARKQREAEDRAREERRGKRKWYQKAVDDVSDATRPLTKPIEETVAPRLKEVVKNSIRIYTAPTEALLKGAGHVAGKLGDTALHEKLNEKADHLARGNEEVGNFTVAVAEETFTAQNVIQVTATVGGNALGGPVLGAALNAGVKELQGEKVTVESVAQTIILSGFGEAAGSATEGAGPILSGAAVGATTGGAKYIMDSGDNPDGMTASGFATATAAGGAGGAAGGAVAASGSSGSAASAGSSSSSAAAANILKSGVSASTEEGTKQYLKTGKVDPKKTGQEFMKGLVNETLHQGVKAGVKHMTPSEKKTEPAKPPQQPPLPKQPGPPPAPMMPPPVSAAFSSNHFGKWLDSKNAPAPKNAPQMTFNTPTNASGRYHYQAGESSASGANNNNSKYYTPPSIFSSSIGGDETVASADESRNKVITKGAKLIAENELEEMAEDLKQNNHKTPKQVKLEKQKEVAKELTREPDNSGMTRKQREREKQAQGKIAEKNHKAKAIEKGANLKTGQRVLPEVSALVDNKEYLEKIWQDPTADTVIEVAKEKAGDYIEDAIAGGITYLLTKVVSKTAATTGGGLIADTIVNPPATGEGTMTALLEDPIKLGRLKEDYKNENNTAGLAYIERVEREYLESKARSLYAPYYRGQTSASGPSQANPREGSHNNANLK